MSQKVHAIIIRLGIIQKFHSYWYILKAYYSFFMSEDYCIRIIAMTIFKRILLQIQIERQYIYLRL